MPKVVCLQLCPPTDTVSDSSSCPELWTPDPGNSWLSDIWLAAHSEPPLRCQGYTGMAEELSPEQVEQYRAAFSRCDTDEDGKINVQELGEVMKALGQNLSEADLKKIIASVDTDGDGTISFQEFLAVVAKKMKNGPTEEELRMVFRAFDLNGDGHISVEELKQAMVQVGEQLSQEELDTMIHEADVDKDGKVNYEEFVRILTQK